MTRYTQAWCSSTTKSFYTNRIRHPMDRATGEDPIACDKCVTLHIHKIVEKRCRIHPQWCHSGNIHLKKWHYGKGRRVLGFSCWIQPIPLGYLRVAGQPACWVVQMWKGGYPESWTPDLHCMPYMLKAVCERDTTTSVLNSCKLMSPKSDFLTSVS